MWLMKYLLTAGLSMCGCDHITMIQILLCLLISCVTWCIRGALHHFTHATFTSCDVCLRWHMVPVAWEWLNAPWENSFPKDLKMSGLIYKTFDLTLWFCCGNCFTSCVHGFSFHAMFLFSFPSYIVCCSLFNWCHYSLTGALQYYSLH